MLQHRLFRHSLKTKNTGSDCNSTRLTKCFHCRQQMGEQARLQASCWDWKAATLHLLNVQYPMAIARFQQRQETRSKKPTTKPAFA